MRTEKRKLLAALTVMVAGIASFPGAALSAPTPEIGNEGMGIGNGVLRLAEVGRISRGAERIRRGGSVIGPGTGPFALSSGACGTEGTIAGRTEDCARAYDDDSARLATAGAACDSRRGSPPCRTFRWLLVSALSDEEQVWLDEASGRLWTFGSDVPVTFEQGNRFCAEQSATLGGEVRLGIPDKTHFSEARSHGIQAVLPGLSDRFFWTNTRELVPGIALVDSFRYVINLVTETLRPAPTFWSNAVWARCTSVAGGTRDGAAAAAVAHPPSEAPPAVQ